MNKSDFNIKRDIPIIILIIIVFFLVFLVFFIEIIKKTKIANSEKNFYIVKNILENENNKCKNKNNNWIFGQSCNEVLKTENISKFFNETKGLINPYNKKNGVGDEPGSVHLYFHEKIMTLSIDTNVNGSIDIKHKISFN